MLFQKDSFFNPPQIIDIIDEINEEKFPPEEKILPKCSSKSKIIHVGNSINFVIVYSSKKFLLKAIKKPCQNVNSLIHNSIALNSIFRTPQPAKFLDNQHIYEDSNYIWSQQEFIDGNIYSGNIIEFQKIIDLITHLHKNRIKISNLIRGKKNDTVFNVEFIEKQFFENVYRFLYDPLLFKILPKKTRELISLEMYTFAHFLM